MKSWNELSMAEKADVMKLAIEGGVYDLDSIRTGYNKFAEGGSKEGEKEGITDEQYLNTMEKVAEENYKNWGYNSSDEALVHALNDNTYNYRGYYNKYPQSKASADTHWTDKFKTVYHPTFSNESIYSSKKSQYNPYGLPGGFWSGEDENASFIPMAWQAINNQYKSGGSIHIKPSHRGRLTELKKRTGKTEAELYNDGNPAHKKMIVFARNARKWKYGDGGNLFDGTSQPTQQMVIHKPYYDLNHTLHYNIDFPEVTIIPDSKLSPAERNYRERQRQKNLPDYEEQKVREYTGIQQLAAQKAWEESTEKKLLDYGQAAATGIGIGTDIVSGLPIYSSLKGASVLSRAKTPLDYAEGAMWIAPALGGAYQTTKPIVKQATQTVIDNGGFAVFSPRIGKVFGKDVGQFTAWVPFDRSWSEGLSWINTGAPTSEGLPIQYITSKHSGEGRKLYDAVINKAREEGYPGIITGRELISAPKTYRTLEHYYPNRVKLDDMGHWSNDSMTGLFEGPKKTVYSLEDFLQSVQETPNERVHFLGAPRYRLETPSTKAPTFKSELDWTPEGWFGKRVDGVYDAEDVTALQTHLPEYLEIEKTAKANGTWLKMPDGSTWQGDPRSWVQLMSKDGQKLVPERWLSSTRTREQTLAMPEYQDRTWTSDSELMADKWTGKAFDNMTGGETFELSYPRDARVYRFNGKGNYYHSLPHPDPRQHRHGYKTIGSDEAVNYIEDRDWGDITKIDNVVEGFGDLVNDLVIHEGVPRKSLLGNNGNFDFLNRNIYKGLLPIGFGTAFYNFNK